VRVQPLATELGITDAAIYHHFGNREGLLDSLARFGARRLRTSMEEVVDGHEARASDIAALVELAVDAFESRGYARLILWLADAGNPVGRGSGMFDAIVSAFESARPGKGKGDINEARSLAALMVMVCAAEPLFGDITRKSVSLPGGKPAARKFRSWFAATVADLLAREA
jgi:AcrR family transcriptional regulator